MKHLKHFQSVDTWKGKVAYAFSRQAIGQEKRPLMRRVEKPLTADGEPPALLERELHYRAEGGAGM